MKNIHARDILPIRRGDIPRGLERRREREKTIVSAEAFARTRLGQITVRREDRYPFQIFTPFFAATC